MQKWNVIFQISFINNFLTFFNFINNGKTCWRSFWIIILTTYIKVENSSLIWNIIIWSIFHFWRKSFKNWDIYKKLRFFRKCLKKVIFLEVDFSKINFGEWYTTMIVCTLWEKCEYYFFQFDYISVIIDKLIFKRKLRISYYLWNIIYRKLLVVRG